MAEALLAFPLEGPRVRIDAPRKDGSSTIVRMSDGESVGHLRLECDGDDLIVRELCIDDGRRSYGCGSEAGWLTVGAGEHRGYRAIRAWAHPELGLSVYYWFRMGLRPVQGEGPDGGIWLERRFR